MCLQLYLADYIFENKSSCLEARSNGVFISMVNGAPKKVNATRMVVSGMKEVAQNV